MPRININEYDYTITGPKSANNNIAVVPINACDGPSDKWVLVHTYDEFIQTFGPNPSSDLQFGSSWEYAANLLLHGMPVLVRRITHKLDINGENSPTLLDNVSIAKGIVKVADTTNSERTNKKTLKHGDITVTDSAYHSVLKPSVKGTIIDNPLYKYAGIIEDGVRTFIPYENVHALESDETNRMVGAFADVKSTNSEWNFIGEHDNEHYKYIKKGETTSMEYIFSMNQLVDEKTGKEFVLGDFFINENNHIVKFTATQQLNENWYRGQKQYPDELRNIDTSELSINHFVDVTYNVDALKAVNLVWVYSEEPTTVRNHKFINGNIKINDDTPYKVFETNADLPIKDVGSGYFAAVQSTNTIWFYNGLEWSATTESFDTLTTVDSTYAMYVTVPFKCTNTPVNTGIYKHYFNWINTGEETYIDDNNPEFVYLPVIYWKNSNLAIGTRSHEIMDGAEIKINEVVINTAVDTVKSSVALQVNGYKDITIDSDFSKTRVESGIFGLTNVSTESVKIYDFNIMLKSITGELSTVYNIGLDKVKSNEDRITTDSLLKVYDVDNKNYIGDPIPKLDSTDGEDRWYIELEPGYSIYYDRNISNGVFTFKVAGFDEFEVVAQTLGSTKGSYDIALTSINNTVAEVTKYYVPESKTEAPDYNNVPVIDANGNFNMFIVEYLYPGTNGNQLNVRLKTIVNQGIYLYVYRNNQFLEKVELCSFRFRNGNTGRVNILDTELDRIDIWKTILLKFGVLLDEETGTPVDGNLIPITNKSALTPLYSNYVKIELNPNIVLDEFVTSISYVYSLYSQSGDVVTRLDGGDNPDRDHVLHEVSKCYKPLADKFRYDFKFITNGGFVDKLTYPKNIVNVFAQDTEIRLIEDAMIDLATARKDCVAFLDVPYELAVEDVPFYFEHISTSYAVAYDPWAYMRLDTGSVKWMPPSFVQLYTHAKSIQNGNKLYLPPAGVRRALVPEIIQTNHDISYKYLTEWQDIDSPQFVNPIIWINGFDYTVFGQKTLYNVVDGYDKKQSALQDLNVRLVANEIKKLIFKTCIELTFELNNIMTWNEFKSKIEPTLSVMLGEGVLTDYAVIMGTETMTSADLNSGHVVGTVRVAIARAATDWDINFELTPNGATFTEYDYDSLYLN